MIDTPDAAAARTAAMLSGAERPVIDTARLETDWERLSAYPGLGALRRFKSGGAHLNYRWANGHGAAVTCGAGTVGGPEGLWEMFATLHGAPDWDSPLGDRPLGRLTVDQVIHRLDALAEL